MKEDLFHYGVKAIIQNEAGDVLLLRYGAAKPDLVHRWDLPGGRIDRGETREQALKRELCEELGIHDVTIDKHCFIAQAPSRIKLETYDVGLLMSFFRCSLMPHHTIVLSHEHEHYEWVEPIEAVERLKHFFPHELLSLLQDLGRPQNRNKLLDL
jgi:8-oxo-dGTP pyrophosphatase MutT (NUDIX family)